MHILTGCISTVPSGRTTSAGSTLQTGSVTWEGRGGKGRGGEGREGGWYSTYVHYTIFSRFVLESSTVLF